MVHRVRLLLASCVVALVAVVPPLPAMAGGEPSTHWVDDDGHAGPVRGCAGGAHALRQVQGAVDASGPGDTVVVCAGRYRWVRILGHRKDGLTVRAAERGATVLLS